MAFAKARIPVQNFIRERISPHYARVKMPIQNFVRGRISPHLTNFYAKIGFADRSMLRDRLITSNLSSQMLYHEGIVKRRFQNAEISELEAFMLSGRVTTDKLFNSSATEATYSVFTGRNETLAKLTNGIISVYDKVSYGLFSEGETIQTLLAFSLGALAAIGIHDAITGAIEVTPRMLETIGLAIITGLGAIAAKIADKLPPHSSERKIADFFKWKVLPLSMVIDGAFLTDVMLKAHFQVTNIIQAMGFGGTMFVTLGVAWLANRFIVKGLRDHLNSYGGHLNPGSLSGTRRLKQIVRTTLIAEANYGIVRLPLFGASMIYLFENVMPQLSGPEKLVLLLPAIFYAFKTFLWHQPKAVREYAREVNENLNSSIEHRNTLSNSPSALQKLYEKRWAISDHLHINLPFYGFGLGIAFSFLSTLIRGSWMLPIAFGTFWGSVGFLFLKELHGIGFSANTNIGFDVLLNASQIDPVGETERKQLTRDIEMQILNPNTGVTEHTYGLFLSLVFNKMPGNSFICQFDRILFQVDDNSKMPFLAQHKKEKEYLDWVISIQDGIFKRLSHDISINGSRGKTDLGEKYSQLAENLEELADYFEDRVNGLPARLRNAIESNSPGGFEGDVEEFRRACFNWIDVRATEFRDAAMRLRRKLNLNPPGTSKDDFEKELSYLLKCYDTELVKIISVVRKMLRGDDRRIRKVENVATIALFRGLTVYSAAYDDGNLASPTDWIWGNWTRVKNPNFRYDAPAGSLGASKYIWVKAEEVLTDIQKIHEDCLSTSPYVKQVDNTPSIAEGFTHGTTAIDIKINDQVRTFGAGEYYFANEAAQDTIPRVKKAIEREGGEAEPDNYLISTRAGDDQNKLLEKTITPSVFAVPLWDFSLMMDKNDVQLTSYIAEAALLIREGVKKRALLIYEYPYGEDFKLQNPFPSRKVDTERGFEGIYGSFELIYEFEEDGKLQRRVIPVTVDKKNIALGTNNDVLWDSLIGATRKANGSLEFTYSEKYVRDGNGTIEKRVLKYKTDEKGNRVPDIEEKVTEQGTFIVPISAKDHVQYLDSLGLPKNVDVNLKVNLFTTAPNRPGDRLWQKISYMDSEETGIYGFARVPDGEEPILFGRRILGK
jgi:hypothetical protein